MQKHASPFASEARRAELAKAGNFEELRTMYSASYPQIPDHNTSKLWDTFYSGQKPIITANPMEEDRLKTVAHFIKGENLEIVNIGFGSGNLERQYFQSHPHTNVNWYGVEISPASIKKVQREFPRGKFEAGDIVRLKFPSDHFDYAIAIEVLEHIPPSKTLQALSEVKRVVKPGGQFILSVPLNEGLEEMLSRGENPNAHVRVYTPELIEAELQLNGFQIYNRKLLYAFHDQYRLKTFLAKSLFHRKFRANNVMVFAHKPRVKIKNSYTIHFSASFVFFQRLALLTGKKLLCIINIWILPKYSFYL